MTAPEFVQVYNPLGWTSSTWMAIDGGPGGSPPPTLPAGVTIVATPMHPFLGVLNEQVLHLAAGSQIGPSLATGGGAGITPDASHRWTAVWSVLLYLPAYPASEATLWSSAVDPYVLNVTPAGTLRLYVGTGLPLAGESTALFPTGVWRQLEVYEVYRDSAGTLLSTRQWVVRVADLTPAWTTFINANADPSQNFYSGGFNSTIGVSRGGAPYFPNPEMYVANVWGAWEDGDGPFGLRRIDGQRPNGIGHLNTWAGNAANVDDVLPDDATTQDMATSPPASQMQLYTLSAPAYITGASLLTASIELGADLYLPANAKGVTNYLYPLISDGTTDIQLGQITVAAEWWWALRTHYGTVGNVVPWTLAALQGLQVGADAETNGTGMVFQASAYLVMVPYAQALGPALPAPVAPATGHAGVQVIML